MMSKEDRESKAVIWMQRLREAEAAQEPLVAYRPLELVRFDYDPWPRSCWRLSAIPWGYTY
jgi:hypothetical protein